MDELFEADVNYLAVVLGALAAQPLGALWYTKLFGEPWMRMRGLTRADAQGGPIPPLLTLAAALVTAYGLARLTDMAAADNVEECIALAAFVWISFAGAVQATQIVHSPKAQNRVALFGIEGGYQLATFVIMGAIIGAFQ
jgi:hypothetical protein